MGSAYVRLSVRCQSRVQCRPGSGFNLLRTIARVVLSPEGYRAQSNATTGRVSYLPRDVLHIDLAPLWNDFIDHRMPPSPFSSRLSHRYRIAFAVSTSRALVVAVASTVPLSA